MGNNYMETMAAVISMMEEKEKMIMSCKEVMQLDCGMTNEKELMQQRACDETERELQLEKKMNEGEALAQENEGGIKFSEEQKREMEELHGKFIQLKKEIVAESSMNLEIERLMALQEDDVLGAKQITDELNKKSSQQGERVQHVLALVLTAEVFAQEARKKLIFELSNVNVDGSIGVKRLGEIDKKPFYAAAAQIYSADEAEAKAAEMCSLWQGYIKNLFDDEDLKLKLGNLKIEFGQEVFKAVITACAEMNVFSPTAKCVVPELWNFEEGRKATLAEGVNQLKEINKSRYFN